MPDQEREVEGAEKGGGHDGRVASLGFRGVGVGRACRAAGGGGPVAISVAVGADAALGDAAQGGGDGGRLAVRRGKVVRDVFDEEALSL